MREADSAFCSPETNYSRKLSDRSRCYARGTAKCTGPTTRPSHTLLISNVIHKYISGGAADDISQSLDKRSANSDIDSAIPANKSSQADHTGYTAIDGNYYQICQTSCKREPERQKVVISAEPIWNERSLRRGYQRGFAVSDLPAGTWHGDHCQHAPALQG